MRAQDLFREIIVALGVVAAGHLFLETRRADDVSEYKRPDLNRRHIS
jgi:hypothetical protein